MKKINEVQDYVSPEVEEIDLALSTVLCGSMDGEASNEDGLPA